MQRNRGGEMPRSRRQQRRRCIEIVHGVTSYEIPESRRLLISRSAISTTQAALQQRQEFFLDRRIEAERRNAEHASPGRIAKIGHLR